VGAGDAAVVIATATHREQLAQRLESRGLRLASAVYEGRYIALDAAETLAKFMVNGAPDATRFDTIIGDVLKQAERAAQGEQPRIVAFGEMVALLFADGQEEAALQLERLWNELAKTRKFYLHCAYPLGIFTDAAHAHSFEQICGEHHHVTPTESFTSLAGEDERLIAIAQLQQKARALETEILEREKAQNALQEREAELRDFVENAVVPLHWVGKDGTILWANQAELALLGYEFQDYVGFHIADFHVDEEAINDILQRLERREELQGYKARVRRRDGEIRTVRIYSNVFYRDKEFVHTRCFTIDVTGRELSERRITAQLAITRLLAESDSLPNLAQRALEIICGVSDCEMSAVWQVQEETGELRCIETWHSAETGFPVFENATMSSRFRRAEGLPGRVWDSNQAAWISDLAEERNFPRRQVALEEGLQSAFAFPIAVRGEVWGVVEFFSRQVRQRDEEFMTMMAAISIQLGEFAERKQVDETRNRLAAIVASSDDAIVSKDLNGIVMSWNHGAERIFGYKAEEIVGRPVTTIIPPELHNQEPEILKRIQAGERIDHFETVRRARNGQLINVSLTISPVKDSSGKIIGAAKIARDITQQRKLESALHTAEKLASVGRLAATVAHEINNPLESVTNFVYLAKTTPDLPDGVRRYLECADQELTRVAHIARQTLGFYRDTSRPMWLEAAKVVEDVLAIYHRKIENKNISCQRRIEPKLKLYALEGELKQILSNLLANAIDASHDQGKLWVSVRSATDRSGRRGVTLAIADNGSGIAAEHRKGIFAPFFTTKKEVGTGLGLWVTKELIEKAGGSLRIRSRVGTPSGTVVRIFLPTVGKSSAEKVQ
jgi:PAS domain S-box-containing protein